MSSAADRPDSERDSNCPVRALLGFDAERLMEDFDQFVASVEVDDHAFALSQWHSFEIHLRRSLRLEEHLLLPAFAKSRALEAQLLRHDEQRIRHVLGQVRSSLELRTLRAEQLRAFHRLLRSHIHRKEGMYAWAELHLTDEQRATLLQGLRGESGSFQAWQGP